MKDFIKNKAHKPPAIAEIIFDIIYLIFAVGAGVLMLAHANGDITLLLYGFLSIILGCGDAFHLIPRVYSLWTDTMNLHSKELGFGKLVTSITMTVFYIMLYYVWQLFYHRTLPFWLTATVFILAGIRIILCLFPQNRWFQKDQPLDFAIYRNIPFVIIGAIVTGLFMITGFKGEYDTFRFMWLAILLSFGFYLAVVLLAGKHKKLGMLMIPKTCAYVWIICMGFGML